MLYDELKGEKKYRLRTTGIIKTNPKQANSINAAHAHHYMPSNYILLEDVFQFRNQYAHNHTLLDLGCGKGRALFVAARFGFQHLMGVELFDGYCRYIQNEVKKNEERYTAQFSIYCSDAALFHIPPFVETIFLYNPFTEQVMIPVLQNIQQSLLQQPRQLFLIYLTPLYRQLLLQAGFEEVYQTSRHHYLKASVFKKTLSPST